MLRPPDRTGKDKAGVIGAWCPFGGLLRPVEADKSPETVTAAESTEREKIRTCRLLSHPLVF